MNNRITLGIILGIGIGMILSSILNISTYKSPSIDSEFIKMEAKKMGMVDPEDFLVREDDKTPVNQQENNAPIAINIPKGSSSEDIAKLLKQSGLITSENEFIDIVTTNEAANKLKWGDYEFTRDESIENILKAIINGS